MAAGSVNFQSKQLSLFAPDAVQRQFGTIPGYSLVNLSVALVDKDDKWKLIAHVRNLFDKAYRRSDHQWRGPAAPIAIRSRAMPIVTLA